MRLDLILAFAKVAKCVRDIRTGTIPAQLL